MTNDTELALSLHRAVNLGNQDDMLEAENAIIERLNINPDETEQGLTKNAVAQIEDFVAKHTSVGWSYAANDVAQIGATPTS